MWLFSMKSYYKDARELFILFSGGLACSLIILSSFMHNAAQKMEISTHRFAPVEIEMELDGISSEGPIYAEQIQEKIDLKELVLKHIEINEVADRVSGTFRVNDVEAYEIVNWIYDASESQEVPFNIMVGLVATESSFRPHVKSWYGAVGLAQVVPRYWESFCDMDLFDPESNIHCGAMALRHYKDSCNKEVDPWDCALKKYNVGPGNYRSGNQEYIDAMDRYRVKIDTNISLLALD